MSANHIPVQFSDRKRRAVDRLTRRLVTCCGVAILLLMLLLFCWLIGVVLPLFNAPGLQIAASQQLWDRAPALAIGNQGKVGWRISERGAARFYSAGWSACGTGTGPDPAARRDSAECR